MTTTAAEKVAGISDVLEENLIRLPAKSLARSKLVSKQWLSQISNPQFLQHHSRHRPNKLPTGMFLTDSKFICRDAKQIVDFVPFSELNPTHQMIPSLGFLYEGIKQIVGDAFFQILLLNSCNGLLLCLFVTFKVFHRKYCVCNPTTKKFRLLPEAPFWISSIQNKCLAFDPSLSLHYKVICTKYFDQSDNPHEIYIYSSENQCWSIYASPFPFDHRGGWFFLNGSMYCTESSLRFDVYTEKMEQITMPPRVDYGYDLLVIGSHLYCAVRKYPFTTCDLQLVEMSSDFSEWVPKYHVSVTPLLSAFPEISKTSQIFKMVYLFDAICVVDGVKEEELDLVLGIPGKLILYNLKKKTARELCKLHDELHDEPNARIYQFIECLFAV